MIDATKLRSLRTDRGYSIRRLADAVGVSYQTIRRLENGDDPGDLPLRVLARIATALGVPPATLLNTDPATQQHDLQQSIGGTILSAPGINATTIATSLGTSVDAIHTALPGLAEVLAEAGLTLSRHGDTLRINPLHLHATPEANTKPMTVNEARLLRRIHRGDDVRRTLSKTDRELTLPSLARAGLVDPTTTIPAPPAALFAVP
ncbi:XRE family transcriptional regulator [Nocardioides guangzhouensis]|uniref:XRE family transcriptional regulator n=1 Tax=Nocardioides guangzhouensis TaxID=2497878 RepID=A0A4Q4ZGC1_9ACTN|nr:helix-turn-helix transcriptional regulator [Nocardioides guangzhouensis]RYP86868.1 XRE family transcriptional regulator [Nocardioides guangzhouensis]